MHYVLDWEDMRKEIDLKTLTNPHSHPVSKSGVEKQSKISTKQAEVKTTINIIPTVTNILGVGSSYTEGEGGLLEVFP